MKTKESNSEGSKPRNLLISTAEAPCIIQLHTPRNVLSVLQNRSWAFSHVMFHGGIFLCFKWDGIPAFPRHTPNALTVPFLPHDAKIFKAHFCSFSFSRNINCFFPADPFLQNLRSLVSFVSNRRVQMLSEGERQMDLRQTVNYIYKSSLSKIHFLRKSGKKVNSTHNNVTCFSFLHAFCVHINGSRRFLVVKSLSLWSSNKQRFKPTICSWGTGLAYGGHEPQKEKPWESTWFSSHSFKSISWKMWLALWASLLWMLIRFFFMGTWTNLKDLY